MKRIMYLVVLAFFTGLSGSASEYSDSDSTGSYSDSGNEEGISLTRAQQRALRAVEKGNMEAVKEAVEKFLGVGGEIDGEVENKIEEKGRLKAVTGTLLHFAICHLPVVEYLVGKGADVNSVPCKGLGKTVVCYALKAEKAEPEVIKFLLACESIDLHKRHQAHGDMPIHAVCRAGGRSGCLYERDEDTFPLHCRLDQLKAYSAIILQKDPEALTKTDEYGNTPAQLAGSLGCVELGTYFVDEYGINKREVDSGLLLAHASCGCDNCYENVCSILAEHQEVQVAREGYDRTALMVALEKEHWNIAQLLVEHNVGLELTDRIECGALAYARHHSAPEELIRLLSEKGAPEGFWP